MPDAPPDAGWRLLADAGTDRGPDFQNRALTWAQRLWQDGFPARALLAIDRALGADAPPGPCYAAISWILAHAPEGAFLGNPRVHYQHLADRLEGERAGLRRARFWAAWAITLRVRPALPRDDRHPVQEPAEVTIARDLTLHGGPDEARTWQALLNTLPPPPAASAAPPQATPPARITDPRSARRGRPILRQAA